jgi:hypothetical protein
MTDEEECCRELLNLRFNMSVGYRAEGQEARFHCMLLLKAMGCMRPLRELYLSAHTGYHKKKKKNTMDWATQSRILFSFNSWLIQFWLFTGL